MKKTMLLIRSVALLLVVSFILPICGSAEITQTTLLEKTNKISAELLQELSGADKNTKIPVSITLSDISHETAMELFAERYPDEYDVYMKAKCGIEVGSEGVDLKVTNKIVQAETIDAETLQRAIELKRSIYRELYTENNEAVLGNLARKEDRIFVSSYAPFAIMEVTKDTIETMVSKRTVFSISKFDNAKGQDEDLNLANRITDANIVRDTYGGSGLNVKIGQIELEVPSSWDSYLSSVNYIPRTQGDPVGTVNSHANRVARILVGTDPNGANDGLAPDATLYSCAIADEQSFYAGVEWLLSQGVNVINMSSGFDKGGVYHQLDKWTEHIAMQHDVHFVKSAGNKTTTNSPGVITSPGMAYNVITVGGLNPNGVTNVANFSMYAQSSYVESGTYLRAEKPNLIAPATDIFGDHGTSFSTPQVAGAIAQLCELKPALKTKQAAMGAILMASAVEKVEAEGSGAVGDRFQLGTRLNPQISDKEGAGILNAECARQVVSRGNYWTLAITTGARAYDINVNLDATGISVARIALFWLTRNTAQCQGNHTVTEVPRGDFDMYLYDPNGNSIDLSMEAWTNYEIIQFTPTISGTYRIQLKIIGENERETAGLAIWY